MSTIHRAIHKTYFSSICKGERVSRHKSHHIPRLYSKLVCKCEMKKKKSVTFRAIAARFTMVNRLFKEMNCLSFTSSTVYHGECHEYCRLNTHSDEWKELFLNPELSLEKN